MMKRFVLYLLAILFISCNPARIPVSSGQPSADLGAQIRTAKLYRFGDQTSFPLLTLGSMEGLELHFDDLDGGVKNYYYSFQLCNADWSPSSLQVFEYIKGFQNVRISNYRNSSATSTRYTHYYANVPDRNCYPSRSGNYLLKVFLNADTTQLAFTKRFVVVENKVAVSAQIQQPFNAQFFRTHQKLQVSLQLDPKIQLLSPTDVKVVGLQNHNWTTSITMDRPTIYRGNYIEYSDESITAIQAGREWRWLDLRSTRLLSDRMEKINSRRDTTEVFVKPESSRSGQAYLYYRDLNGSYSIEAMESVNPFWQTEYSLVHFRFVPPGNRELRGQDVYIFGELTNYGYDESGKMDFNEEKGIYEKTLYLKQGFYNYTYMSLPDDRRRAPDFSLTEGNFWSTENSYIVLVYYRPFGARADELIGAGSVNSNFSGVIR